MSNKIIFGADLIDVLENKYNMNQLANVPTKYKNGITTIDFIYGKEKDIDDLKYNKPYVEFSIDDETDGFISGTMYLNGGVEGIQFDSWEDLKYFMKNAKWTESKKSARKSLKEGIDVKIVYADDTPSEYIDDITRSDILDIIEESPEVYKIFDVSGSKKKLVWSDEYGFERAYESKKSAIKSLKEKKFNPNDYFYELIELNGKQYKDWTVFEWKDIEDDFFKAYATWGKTFFNMYSGNSDSNSLVNDGKLMSVLDKNGVQIKGKELNEIAYELNELIRNYKKTESNKFVGKLIKESKDSDFFNGIAKEYHFSKDEKTRYKDKTHISVIGVLFDRINDAIKIYGRNSDEEYNALNDCWSVITSAKQNGWNVDYEEDKWNKIARLPNYH